MPRSEKVERSGLDTSHDVKMIGTYNRRGTVYIDRTAASTLTPEERRQVEIHERVELTKRLEGKPYSVAHRETEALFPFTDELKSKLHSVATKVLRRSMEHPDRYSPPRDMYDDVFGSMRGGAVEDPLTDIEKEYLKRQIQRGRLKPIPLSELTDSDLNEIVATQREREKVQNVTDRAIKTKDRAGRVFDEVSERANRAIEERHEADLAGRAAGGLNNLQEGMAVVKCPKTLVCGRCGKEYKPEVSKVFKKVYSYFCPACGGQLNPPRKPATKGFDILRGSP